ncbi:DAPG hydrolase family protein [Leptospira sp. GIMC2001]|uniref:DAPG hydrolase family protein n=1 Tax=Leptospira sp. GIMC2001 TaxID=1513297 RepID=UPI00234A226F|nr:hypothetical protein [Leptospira sp. GIMC2001]WCL49224.1 hypothetical protein O4O04_18310 [Leptospira sp. GIMC2001]
MKKVDIELKEPLPVQWNRKSVDSAESGRRILPDGRIEFWIKHSIVKNVSPKMLVWWFKNIEGDISYKGGIYNRYRVWHPEDHVHNSYQERLPDGSIGVGAVLRIVEYLGRNKKYIVNITTKIEKLDEEGFIHNPKLHGILPMAKMVYSFKETEQGTIYENSLILGWKGWTWKLLRFFIEPVFFPPVRGYAWIKHNIEEVGQFEDFLPELYNKEVRQ